MRGGPVAGIVEGFSNFFKSFHFVIRRIKERKGRSRLAQLSAQVLANYHRYSGVRWKSVKAEMRFPLCPNFFAARFPVPSDSPRIPTRRASTTRLPRSIPPNSTTSVAFAGYPGNHPRTLEWKNFPTKFLLSSGYWIHLCTSKVRV